MKDLSLHILDIVQNSIRAGAETIAVDMSVEAGIMTLMVSDDGKGMDEEQVNRVKDPFFTTRTTRKIGLGVALLTQKAEQAGGGLTLHSTPGKGTELRATFQIAHPDCPPLGDIPGSAWMLMASNPELRMIFRFSGANETFEWDSKQIQEALEGVSISDELVKDSVIEWFISDFCKFNEFAKG